MSKAAADPKWRWEEIDPSRSAASGDYSKLFKNEPVKAPGVLEEGRPEDDAALLVREAVQNSWDAALESRGELPSVELPPFDACFRLLTLHDQQRRALVQSLGLCELADRACRVERLGVGLATEDCLSSLDDDAAGLRLMEISENATGGMHGPWNGPDSKLYMALCSLQMTPKSTGQGGSYGYGKAGLIRASKVRVVVAYTCFAEREEDPGVTRRLLGMTYWGQHKLDGNHFTGAARFGEANVGGADPFTNEAADAVAHSLGMAARNHLNPADLGTTFLLVEPTVEAEDLITAVERYWWPALHEQSLQFHVSAKDEAAGKGVLHPRPRRDAALRPFLEAYEAATTPQDNKRLNVRTSRLDRIGEHARPGVVALVADPDGWSYADSIEADNDIEHKSLVALIRKPRMVVEYYEAGRTAPYIRGVFIADDTINEALRGTEPKGHDAWQTRGSSCDIAAEHAELAGDVLKRIKSHVNKFRGEIKPKPKPPDQVRLPEFDRIMRVLFGGAGGGPRPPVADPRPFSIRPGGEVEATSDGRLRLEGAATVSLSENHDPGDKQSEQIEVSLRYRFIEDDRTGDEVEMVVVAPPGFEEVKDGANTYRGTLSMGEEVRFSYVSDDYDPEWTGRLYVTAELADAAGTGATDAVQS